MSSIYPNGIDGFSQLPLVVDTQTPVNAISVNRIRDAVVNVEAELGVSPSGLFPTVRARLDAMGGIIAYKNPARAATTGNVNLSSAPLVVDGVTLEDDDRVLVYNQTNKHENGIYTVTAAGTGSNGSWTRSNDANNDINLMPGTEVYVVEGNTNRQVKFWLITPGPLTIGTTPLEFIPGLQIMQSDATPTTVYTNHTVTTVFTPTNHIDVRNFKEIEWFITIDDRLSATLISAQIQFSDLETPTIDDWAFLETELIEEGIATLYTYEAQKDISTIAPATKFRVGVSSGIRGRTMRLVLKADLSTSNVVVTAMRRC